MKRVWKNKEAVSPVIATILMVAITVVLAAVLYVMVIGMGGDTGIETPLGLNQQSRSLTNVTILVASAPNGALIDGTAISLTHGGAPTPIVTAIVYSSGAAVVGTYVGATGTWTVASDAEFQAGMSIVIVTTSVSNGDVITISSTEERFGTTTVNVN